MNITQLVTIAVPFIALLGAIVAGVWINQRAIEKQMEAFRSEIKAEMGAFKSEIRAEFITVITPLRSDVSQVKHSVEKMERQFEAIFNRLILPK